MALKRYNRNEINKVNELQYMVYGAEEPVIEKDPNKFLITDLDVKMPINLTNIINFKKVNKSSYEKYKDASKDVSNNTIIYGYGDPNFISLGNTVFSQYVKDISILKNKDEILTDISLYKITVTSQNAIESDDKTNVIIQNKTDDAVYLVDYTSFKTDYTVFKNKVDKLQDQVNSIQGNGAINVTIGNGEKTGEDTTNKFVAVKVATINGVVSNVEVTTKNIASLSTLKSLETNVITNKNDIAAIKGRDLTHEYNINDSNNYIGLELYQDKIGNINKFNINVQYADGTKDGIVNKNYLKTYVLDITSTLTSTIDQLQKDVNTNKDNIATNRTNITNNTTNISNVSSRVKTNEDNIATHTSNIADISNRVNTNMTNISANATNISDISNRVNTNMTNISANATNISDVSSRFNTYKTNTDASINEIRSSIKTYDKATTSKLGLVQVGYTKPSTSGTGTTLNLPVNIDSNGNLYVSILTSDIKYLGFSTDTYSFTPVVLETT